MVNWIKSFFKNLFSIGNKRSSNLGSNTFKISLDNKDYIFKTGLIKDPYDPNDKIKHDIDLTAKNVVSDDKNFSLRAYAPNPRQFNQGSTGSCTGFSSSAMIYIMVKRMQELVGKMDEVSLFSPLWIYWFARLHAGIAYTKEDGGANLRNVMKTLNKEGAIEEKYWSFSRHYPLEEPDSIAKQASAFKIYKYMRIPLGEENTIQLVKDILSKECLPILLGIYIYSEQQAYAHWNGKFREVRNKNKAKCIGGHAVCVTGYVTDEDTGECYLEFINSWSESWGDAGYGYIPIKWLNDSFYVMDAWCADKGYF